MTFGFLVLWMFSGVFSKDGSGSIEKIEITSEQTNTTLVRARQFEAEAKHVFRSVKRENRSRKRCFNFGRNNRYN